MDKPQKVIYDLSKPKGEREIVMDMTDEEIAELEALQAELAARQAQEEAEEQALADLKASAKAKLIAGEPLTAEEAETLVI